MSCQRTPPASPRAPKIQQQSWDDCDSPPIDLFDPYRQNIASPPRSPSHRKQPPIILQQPPKSPKSSRKYSKTSNNVNCYYDTPSVVSSVRSPTANVGVHHHGTSRSFNNFQVTSNNSPKYENPPRSPKITTTYANDDDDHGSNNGHGVGVIVNNGDIIDNDDDDCITSASSSTSYYQTPTSGSRSPKQCGGSGGGGNSGSIGSGAGGFNSTGYYTDSRNQSPRPSPKSPRKFVFDAISPSYEQKGKKFDYYDPLSPEEKPPVRHCNNASNIYHHSTTATGGRELPYTPGQTINQHHSARRNSKTCKSRPLPNPNIIASGCDDDNINSGMGIGIALNKTSRNNCDQNCEKSQHNNDTCCNSRYSHHSQHSNIHSHQHQQQQQQQEHQQHSPHLLDEFPTGTRNIFLKRDSCMTESTQLSGDSGETNGTINTMTTSLSCESPVQSQMGCTVKIPGNGGNGKCPINSNGGVCNNKTCSNSGCTSRNINTGDSSSFASSSNNENSNGIKRKEKVGRRHAINITSNPGYQVLHSSHSTLDRTCSDSVVSLRYRKSTSDLTNMDDCCNGINIGGYNKSMSSSTKQIRRRGSSKGGLAYLASRRSSRESIKSACSNASIFSNEDVGPLTFQSSTRGRQRRTSNFLELPVPDHIRPRVCSLPDRPYNPRVSDDLYRLRHFSISKGTVVNCGDSIISRRSRSNTSVNSTTSRASERSPFDGSCCGGGYANVDSLPPSPTDSEDPPPPPRYRIVMLGDSGVGKTALVSQFMTSEYMHTYDASLGKYKKFKDDEFGEKTVSILLDDEESELVFIDHPSVEMSVENSLSTYEPHGCVIVYSIVDRNSFRVAEDTVNYLWREGVTKEKAVILVANKCDLARSRMITSNEGKTLAANRDIKFIETSSGIQHNVDELLVGTLKQIRLKEKRDKKMESKMKSSRTHISLHLAKEILQKICLTDITKSKSCENLHVL
ncbi:uncharacterized protein LOC129606700 isoform X3 [Condylostylus longicornis]|uniref:uncharacterized protein LOC129606700 isoform X3 n=1 Tax=Condylostylus longicornis TaxID=2530218 RepID=UPI00244D9ABD|nr:uncharacterized protein LOC129606700 isoform X3 [Condylostylus longicornis]